MKKLTLFSTMLCLFLAGAFSRGMAQDAGKDSALEAIGGLSGAMMYNTYLAIGAVGDGYEEKVYDADYVHEIMTEQIGLMDNLQEQLLLMKSSGFLSDPSDRDYIDLIVETLGYLSDEADGLIDYTHGGSSDAFQEGRTKAWANIAEILGIEDED